LSRIYTFRRSLAADRDRELIFDHLVKSYTRLGDDPADAFDRASKRVATVDAAMDGLGRAPFQGTLREDAKPGLRQVTKDSAIFFFLTNEAAGRVDVLAVFFGGQDHQRRMLSTLLSGE
jgi:toxin ParE1/3/4